jgi:outer membrane protein assembly factor BamB
MTAHRMALVAGMMIFASTASAADANWPRWRGPNGDSHSDDPTIPIKWNASSVVWKTELKGSGQSSPVVWGDRIFLTSALGNGKTRLVICVDRKSGQVLWEKEAWSGEPEPSHAQNGWATATCATDGERVVAFFGKGGLHCFGVDGTPLWSRNLGDFPGQWGVAASPIIVNDLVIQNCDAVGESKLIAFNKKDGQPVWTTQRPSTERGGWSTPVLIEAGGKGAKRMELVLNGEPSVNAYDPATGKQLWSCKSFAGRGDPSITPGNGLLFVINGQPGDIYAIKPGGMGDVRSSHLAWHTPRKSGRDQPSPILIKDYLIVTSMGGLATCYQASTGKELWTKERLKGAFSSSPIAARGLAFFQNEAGETTVVEPGPKFKVVGQNTLGAGKEVFRASLTPSAGQIFARSDSALYCIGAGKK